MSAELIAHMTGDYVVQSDWMAQQKTRSHLPAAAHALSYAACFLPLTRDPRRLAFIAGSHFVIDRWRLARYVVWAKNQIAPRDFRYPPSHADGSGYHADLAPYQHDRTNCHAVGKPPWMSVWLFIFADNTMHLLCNHFALAGGQQP